MVILVTWVILASRARVLCFSHTRPGTMQRVSSPGCVGTAKGDQDSPFLSHLQGVGEKIPSNKVRDFSLQSDTLLTPKEWSGEGHMLSSQGSSCELGGHRLSSWFIHGGIEILFV